MSKLISVDRKRQLETFEAKFADVHQFTDLLLLNESLTHDSCRDRQDRPVANYQRLEWIGEAVIKFILSTHLFASSTSEKEGQMSYKRSLLESKMMLNTVANELMIERYVRVGPECVQLNGYHNFVEALVGAIYVDARRSGRNWEQTVRGFMAKYWIDPQYGRRITLRPI